MATAIPLFLSRDNLVILSHFLYVSMAPNCDFLV